MREVVIKKIKLPKPEWGMNGATSEPVVLLKIDHERRTIAFYKLKGSDPNFLDVMSLFHVDKDLNYERAVFVERYNKGRFDGYTFERVVGFTRCEHLHLRYSECAWASRYTSPRLSLKISTYKKLPCDGTEWDIDDFLLLTAETGWWPVGKLQKPIYLRINKKSIERQETVKHYEFK